MTPDLGTFLRLFGETLRDPAAIARQMRGLRWPHEIAWMGLGAVTALSVLVVYASSLLPGAGDTGIGFSGGPLVDGIIIGAMTVILIFVLYYAGRAIGGTGSFGATLLTITWFQAVVLVLLTIQLIANLIAPGLSGIVALIALGLQLYCLIHFLNELHGFDSLWKAAGLFFMSICGVVFGVVIILLVIGGASFAGGFA